MTGPLSEGRDGRPTRRLTASEVRVLAQLAASGQAASASDLNTSVKLMHRLWTRKYVSMVGPLFHRETSQPWIITASGRRGLALAKGEQP